METITLQTRYSRRIAIPMMYRTFEREHTLTLIQMRRLKKEIKNFEQKYGMTSDDFYRKFEKGKLGDEQIFFLWSSSIDIYNNLSDRQKVLKEFIKQCKA